MWGGPGLDYAYHVQTTTSVERGTIWGIRVHIIQKKEVLFFSSVDIFERLLRILE
jgi:hypothetical protein